jgi:tetratricopeptide (TPR) repeat protein
MNKETDDGLLGENEWIDEPLYTPSMGEKYRAFLALTIPVNPKAPPPPDLLVDEVEEEDQERPPASSYLLSLEAERIASLFAMFKLQPAPVEKAIVRFEAFLKVVPRDPKEAADTFALHALNLFREDEIKYASLAVSAALERNPEQALAEMVRAEIFRKSNRYVKASESYRRVQELGDPTLAEQASYALSLLGSDFEIF